MSFLTFWHRSTSCMAPLAAPLAEDLWPVPLRQLHHGPHHRLRRHPLLHPGKKRNGEKNCLKKTSPPSSTWIKFGHFLRTRTLAQANWSSGKPWNRYRFTTFSLLKLTLLISQSRWTFYILHWASIIADSSPIQVNIEFRRQSEKGVIAWLDHHFPPSTSV